MKIYRNIFFYGPSMKLGKGSIDIWYSGKIFNNAKHIKDFSTIFDETKDLLITCGSCAEKKYGKLIKTKQK